MANELIMTEPLEESAEKTVKASDFVRGMDKAYMNSICEFLTSMLETDKSKRPEAKTLLQEMWLE